MTTIAELPSLAEACVVKSMLEAGNIDALIPDEDMGGDAAELAAALDIRVQVDDEDVERALKIVQGFPNAIIRHPQSS